MYDLRVMFPIFNENSSKWTVDIEVPGGNHSEAEKLWSERGQWFKCIAVTGQFNAGKSLLLSTLTDRSLPSGNHVSTRGISAVHMKDKNILLLDSAGADFVDAKHLKDMEGDTLEEIREHFQSEILMDMSTNFVHVVGKLTRHSMRGLWCQLKRLQKRKRADLTVVYNLYPHDHDIDKVRQKANKIIEGYGNLVKAQDAATWSFKTIHEGTAKSQIIVHHWFWLDDKWSKGWKINRDRVPLLWAAFDALPGAQPLTTEKTLRRALETVIPKFVVPQGMKGDIVFEGGTAAPKAKPGEYSCMGKFQVTLQNEARMQHVSLVTDVRRRLIQAHNGFLPTARIFRSREEHLILIDAPYCVLSGQPHAEGQGVITVESKAIKNWNCVHISITKTPFLDDSYRKRGDSAPEQSGTYSLYHPPINDTSVGEIELWGEPEYTNGLLVVRMRPPSSKEQATPFAPRLPSKPEPRKQEPPKPEPPTPERQKPEPPNPEPRKLVTPQPPLEKSHSDLEREARREAQKLKDMKMAQDLAAKRLPPDPYSTRSLSQE